MYISVREVTEAIDLESVFFLPLSRQAWEEFQQLQEVLQEIPYDDNSKDIWQPIWGRETDSNRCCKRVWIFKMQNEFSL
jgi:hypothetical protein